MKTKFKWIAFLAIMFVTSVNTYAQKSKAKPEAIVYVNAAANYGFRITAEGKTILQQEQIQRADNEPVIYFNKAEAEKAAVFALKQINEGAAPTPITYSNWQEIQKTPVTK